MDLLEHVLQVVETDPLPEAHTSSHWKEYGAKTVVSREGTRLILRGAGFGIMTRPRLGVLSFLERLSYRHAFSTRSHAVIWKLTKRLARDLGIGLTYDVWKASMVAATLADHWQAHRLQPKTFLLIGDGYGVLGGVIHRLLPAARLYFVDLPKILVFQVNTMQRVAPQAATALLSADRSQAAHINFVFPRDLEHISEPVIDCAINVASMQEMNTSSIAQYFSFLRRRTSAHSRFYCVNRLRKELPGGEVTDFRAYPWHESDEIFLDGVCPYYTHFLSSRTLPNGPRVLGVRIPFVNYFDGVIVHRLARLGRE